MTLTVTNQQPVVLDPVHTIGLAGDFDPIPAVGKSIVDPLSTPLNASTPVNIVDGQGNDVSGQIMSSLMACLGDQIDPAAETWTKDLLGQCLLHFDRATGLPVGELFAIQAGVRLQWPSPAAGVIYTAQADVIPAAKGLLARTGDPDELFAALAYAYHPDTLGFWFQSQTAFTEFQAWLNQQTAALGQATLPAETSRLLTEFGKLTLSGLTESLLLRRDLAEGNEPFSFARLIAYFLMSYLGQQNQQAQQNAATAGVLPFSVGELFCPRSLVLVNAEMHARATPAKINAEWAMINAGIASPVKVVSHHKLNKLTALQRNAARAKVQATRQQVRTNKSGRSAQVVFRKRPPSRIQLVKAVMRVLSRMGKVNRSQNVLRTSKTSFLKANRRRPDDYNKPGRIVSTQYMPDLHVYIDTSGSISEENYQQAVMMLIRMAKKMNVDLYVSSFSTILSQETMLHTKDKSVAQIWTQFRRIPKVTGGTNFRQIWDYVNASPVRRRRLSLVVTDFCWDPPPQRVDHPANLYYAPCSSMDWDQITGYAAMFADKMKHIDPAIHQKLLGLVV